MFSHNVSIEPFYNIANGLVNIDNRDKYLSDVIGGCWHSSTRYGRL